MNQGPFNGSSSKPSLAKLGALLSPMDFVPWIIPTKLPTTPAMNARRPARFSGGTSASGLSQRLLWASFKVAGNCDRHGAAARLGADRGVRNMNRSVSTFGGGGLGWRISCSA